MSMLAERRTKKKWCLNPNGRDWSNDDSKFGQRMLEKMGWKKGCGLGVKLQGMKEHVRVAAKNDTKGLGCKNNSDTEWIHHQQNFETLLSELACSTNEEIRPPGTSEIKPVSLEEKSKKSRVRVHYQKFTRGKDVARYSANDLACIFGKKCSSVDSKSFETQYSCHVTARNISEADSEDSIISDGHTVEQSLNLCQENTTDDCLPSLLPKHRAKDQPVLYSCEDKDVKEKQKDILKEISNVTENSVAELDIVEECKNEMLDNSASNSLSDSLEKIRNKRKRKCVKNSENNEEVMMISSSQDEVNECDTVAYEIEEEKKKRKKKKKDKKKKVKVDDETGKEDNEVLILEELIEVISDAEETGTKDLENAGVISEADTANSKIKKKKTGKLYQTNISEAHEEFPEMKKRKKKKMCSQSLNATDVVGDITSEIVSPLPPDNKTGVNNLQKSINYPSEPFSSYKEESHQYDRIYAVKHIKYKKYKKYKKSVKKHCRKSMDFGFKGSNLNSISGYGSL